jgi:hypothetical protein
MCPITSHSDRPRSSVTATPEPHTLNCEQFPNNNHKHYNAHEEHKQPFPSENYNQTRHEHVRSTSADSIPPFVIASVFIVAS